MKDVRISIRLTEEEHKKFKIIAIKKGKCMQEILKDYINNLIQNEDKK